MAKKEEIYVPPLHKRLLKLVLSLLKYPRSIARRYAAYNGAIGEMFMEIGDRELNELRKRNVKLVNLFIYLPMALGVVALAVSVYLNRQDILLYFDRLFATNYSTGFKYLTTIAKRIGYMVTNFPIGYNHIQWFFYGYLGSIFGAWILSLNPGFKKEAEIRHIFATLNNIDSEGNPWKVTWTPNAIMITSFNCDPHELVARMRFWSSINFPPSAPRVFKNNMNKFIVQRK